jgi:nitrogen fixation NifU-like protein
MSAATDDLYQEIVVEHKRAPRHFGPLAAPTHQARGRNPQCGDDVQVQLRLEDGKVRDVGFTGQGCAICMASASMMTEAVLGRDEATVRDLQQHFRAVLTGQAEPEEARLGKLVSLAGVRGYPSRIKCALLGWHALMHALAEPAGTGAAAEPAALPTVSTEDTQA